MRHRQSCALMFELDIAELLDALQGRSRSQEDQLRTLSFGNLFEHLLSPHENEAVALSTLDMFIRNW